MNQRHDYLIFILTIRYFARCVTSFESTRR